MKAKAVREYKGIKSGDDVLVRCTGGVWERHQFEAYITTDNPYEEDENSTVFYEGFITNDCGFWSDCLPYEEYWWLEGTDACERGHIWRPRYNTDYYRVDFSVKQAEFVVYKCKWQSGGADRGYFLGGMAFGDFEEAKKVCYAMNMVRLQNRAGEICKANEWPH